MENSTIAKITVAVIILLAVIFLIYCLTMNNSNPDTYQGLKELFNNTTKDVNNLGGILCNNFGPEWFQAMLDRGEVSLQDTSVCAHVNRKTCTAYSYLRRDLIPMLFMFPGVEASVPCGIILDPQKVWPLITLMAIVDGDTNNRSCCTNESGGAILTRSPWTAGNNDLCIYNSMKQQVDAGTLDKKYITGSYAVYIPDKDKGVTGGVCNTSCNGNRTCMYNNSGGNINQWLMNSSPECIAGKYANCFVFTEVDPSTVPKEIKNLVNPAPDGWLSQSMSPSCKTCKKPFLCVFKDAPQTTTQQSVAPGMQDLRSTRVSPVGMQFDTASGAEARRKFLVEGFNDSESSENKYKTIEEADRIATYIGKNGFGMNTTVTHDMMIGDIAIKQCRFERDDWNAWIKVLKQHYENILGILRKDNSMVDTFNYQLAHPQSPSYFENEVNLYIDPDTSSDEYKKQNKIWQDSIIGFYYTATDCEEQLAPLKGVPSNFYGNEVSGVVDRCNGFFNMTTQDRKNWEKDRITMSRVLVHEVADLFHKTQNRKVPVYKCTADSNAFPNYRSLIDAFNGDVKLSSIFQPDDDYKK
jgi:hypothetical protein